jgi:malonyl-CoA/methylmalonyl-CoA synthetase
MTNHMFDLVRARAADGSRPFIEADDGRSLTYGDMIDLSAGMARALVKLGVAPGDRVAVQVGKSVEMIVLYLACLRAGAVFLPLNTAYTPAEVAYFVGDARPALFVVDPARAYLLADCVAEAGAAMVSLGTAGDGSLMDAAVAEPPQFDDVSRGPDDLAALLYTSGTTGRSKGAMLTHDNLLSNAIALTETWRFTSSDILIHALPLFHTHGLFVATNVILNAGASMILQAQFDPERIVAALPRATTLMGVPTFYVRLLQHPGITREATAGMRLFVSGSAPLLAETHAEWQRRTGHAILERYGMTETNMNSSNPYEGERRAGTVGFALPGTDIRIAPPDSGAPLPRGEIGMIEVRGPNVFKGYWGTPDKTAAEFRSDGYFITGDLGRFDEDGYLHIVGRGKDLIIAGGYNIYPKEIELEIDALPGVVESAVIGLPHPDLGEAVVAVVVRMAGADIAADAIVTALASRLARFKHPRRVIFVDELPRNTMGKVQKNVLRDRHAGLFDAPPPDRSP